MAELLEVNGKMVLRDEWSVQDIQDTREDLTYEQAAEVLKVMAENYDANNGINWEFISECAYELYPNEEA